eukprot:5416899-Heterocapsa_arctica.AAC.1
MEGAGGRAGQTLSEQPAPEGVAQAATHVADPAPRIEDAGGRLLPSADGLPRWGPGSNREAFAATRAGVEEHMAAGATRHQTG